jgi:hypothetical protein
MKFTFREFDVAGDFQPPRTETDRLVPDLSFSGRSVSRCTSSGSRQPMEFLQLIDTRAGLSFPLIKTSVQIRRAAGARRSQFFESLRRRSSDHSRRPGRTGRMPRTESVDQAAADE